ncbi:YueI family protein [Peribacillus sp. SCS-155]|uniref:YueI family protein n=1 Tax=Peribacillus sedimenti TaxID=3115297 RepID=UPI00390589D1
MKRKNVDDYLQEGISGKKELKAEERRTFLGTYRERVIVALTEAQVRGQFVYPEISANIQKYHDSVLLLNANVEYKALAKYIKVAQQHKISYKIVDNKEFQSHYGLVLAARQAVDKEVITVSEALSSVAKKKQAKNTGFLSVLGGIFKTKSK